MFRRENMGFEEFSSPNFISLSEKFLSELNDLSATVPINMKNLFKMISPLKQYSVQNFLAVLIVKIQHVFYIPDRADILSYHMI